MAQSGTGTALRARPRPHGLIRLGLAGLRNAVVARLRAGSAEARPPPLLPPPPPSPAPHRQRRPSVDAREAGLLSPCSSCLVPPVFSRPRRAGAMRLGPRPAALGLLLLYAAVAGAGKAEELHYPQGEHRADYDREALLGVQVRMPGRVPHRHGLCPGTKLGGQARPWLGRPDNGGRAERRLRSRGP